MSHSGAPELPQRSSALGTVPSSAPSARSYAAVLAALVRDPTTSYRLRQLIQDDRVLRQSGVLADDVLLERLDVLVNEDAAIQGPREVPPGPVLHTEAELTILHAGSAVSRIVDAPAPHRRGLSR